MLSYFKKVTRIIDIVFHKSFVNLFIKRGFDDCMIPVNNILSNAI